MKLRLSSLRCFFFHAAVSCTLACIAAKILDWYNPFMDFWGQMWLVRLVLVVSLILAAGLTLGEKTLQRRQ